MEIQDDIDAMTATDREDQLPKWALGLIGDLRREVRYGRVVEEGLRFELAQTGAGVEGSNTFLDRDSGGKLGLGRDVRVRFQVGDYDVEAYVRGGRLVVDAGNRMVVRPVNVSIVEISCGED